MRSSLVDCPNKLQHAINDPWFLEQKLLDLGSDFVVDTKVFNTCANAPDRLQSKSSNLYLILTRECDAICMVCNAK